MTTLPVTSDDRLIWDTWLSSFRFPALTVADEIGVIRALSVRAMSTDELADSLEVNTRALGVLLGALAAMGFVERRELRWRSTAAARTWMDPQADGYYGPLLHGYRESQPLHAQLRQVMRTGERPDNRMSAADEWERGELPRDRAAMITAFMHAHSRAAAKAVAMQPMFGEVRSIMDVGGGSAVFSIEMAKAWLALRATVMEIDVICEEAERYIAKEGVSERVRTQAVNMFKEEWPSGHDALFFSNIFHDWSDTTCRLLAKKAFAALAPGGMIVLHEVLMDDDGCGPFVAAAFSLLMLLGTKGKQYSLPELREILESAGFVDTDACSVGSGYYSLVTARKPIKGVSFD